MKLCHICDKEALTGTPFIWCYECNKILYVHKEHRGTKKPRVRTQDFMDNVLSKHKREEHNSVELVE